MSIPLPDLPESEEGWSSEIIQAYNSIQSSYAHAVHLIDKEDVTVKIPLQMAYDSLSHQGRVLNLMSQSTLPEDWIHEVALCLALERQALGKMISASSQGVSDSGVQFHRPVHVVYTGRRGRPRKVVDFDYLKEAMSDQRNISVAALAKTINIHPNTLRHYMDIYGLSKDFSNLTDEEIDALMLEFKENKPASGLRYAMGFIRRKNLRIQRQRLADSLKRVGGLSATLRKRNVIKRRAYKVSRPNALWHCDGHHKLIRWGIVLHGFIDGYSRLITALKANVSNSSSRVLKVFKSGTQKYGLPSRVRGDRGGENVKVSLHMILHRGPNRASFMWGSSTHNTRIERLWVEVGTQFVRPWRVFFTRLERLHGLDPGNPHHLWLLHFIFLSEINQDADDFRRDWNLHPISTAGNRSPHDLFLLGQTEHGVYSEYEEIAPEILCKYYGVAGRRRYRAEHETGAGHASDEQTTEHPDSNSMDLDDSDSDGEEDPDWEDELSVIERMIAADISENIRHRPVKVKKHSSPFGESESAPSAFAEFLQQLFAHLDGSSEYVAGVQWEAFEHIPLGRSKELVIDIHGSQWRLRAKKWLKALELLSSI